MQDAADRSGLGLVEEILVPKLVASERLGALPRKCRSFLPITATSLLPRSVKPRDLTVKGVSLFPHKESTVVDLQLCHRNELGLSIRPPPLPLRVGPGVGVGLSDRKVRS